jgi:hypothetical protein
MTSKMSPFLNGKSSGSWKQVKLRVTKFVGFFFPWSSNVLSQQVVTC